MSFLFATLSVPKDYYSVIQQPDDFQEADINEGNDDQNEGNEAQTGQFLKINILNR